MPGYQVKFETHLLGTSHFEIRSLLNRQQYADPDGAAQAAGISSASWPLFGMVWPSARMLANAMQTYDIAGKRILEIGCGLALASLVIHRRQGDIIVLDPDRGNRNGFCRKMDALGYTLDLQRAGATQSTGEAYKGHFLNFSRS